jgi:hypothetical protein
VGHQKFLALIDASPPLDDSGYETPSKRPRCPPPGLVTSALTTELERGYESLYLCTPGSLLASFDKGLQPPVKNSAIKYLSAQNAASGWTRSIGSQLRRVENYRNQKREPTYVDLADD